MTRVQIQITDKGLNAEDVFNNAFKSKVGTENKPIETHKWVKQDKYILHQTYPINTWLIDLVKFNEFWYVFFVEANTRYLIVIQGNSNFLSSEAVEININRRVDTNTYFEVFNEFIRLNNNVYPTLLIGDSEKVFWSNDAQQFYKEHNISTKIINTVVEGHNGLSILDRLVKTIRDMAFKLEQKGTPDEIIYLVATYNNTYHNTFLKYLNKKLTPLQLHESETLQKQFNEALTEENLKTRLLRAFYILPGTEVVVKKEVYEKFEKRRSSILKGKWFVLGYNYSGFTIREQDSDEILESIPRSRLRPIYHPYGV